MVIITNALRTCSKGFLWWVCGEGSKNCRSLTGNNHINYQKYASSIFVTLNSQCKWTNLSQKPQENKHSVPPCLLLIIKPCYAGEVDGFEYSDTIIKIYLKKVEQRKEGEVRVKHGERKRRKQSSKWLKQAAKTPAMTAATRAACQTFGVISCFVEDFYGILAA